MSAPAPLHIRLACGLTVTLAASLCPDRIWCRLRLPARPHQGELGDILVSAVGDMHRVRTNATGEGDPWKLWVEGAVFDLDGIEQAQQAQRWVDDYRASYAQRLLASKQRAQEARAA